MVKFRAIDVYNRALALADLQNSNFISYGDGFYMLNAAYRKVYQDAINQGDLNYLVEVRLIANRNSTFKLPDDFYQLAMVTDDYGNEIPMLRLAYSMSDYGYLIKNGTIVLRNVNGNVILKYYPVPDTITFKNERRQSNKVLSVSQFGTPFTGFDTKVFTTSKYIYDMQTSQAYNMSTLVSSYEHVLVGRDGILVILNGEYKFAMFNTLSYASAFIRPLLTTSGNFIENTFDNINGWGWCNDDASARYVVSSGNVYFNGNLIGTAADLMRSNLDNGRVIYWNGQWCFVTLSKIVYPDGSWESTDSPTAIALLKCDTETGYGYVIPTVNNFSVEGWTPDTVIDYPNNTLFDLTVYELAIQFRIKQGADPSGLMQMYQQLEKTYNKTISMNNDDFPTIRNVDRRFTKWSLY